MLLNAYGSLTVCSDAEERGDRPGTALGGAPIDSAPRCHHNPLQSHVAYLHMAVRAIRSEIEP